MIDHLARRELIARRVNALLDAESLRITPSRLTDTLRRTDLEGARIFEEELILREGVGASNRRIIGLKNLSISIHSVHRILGLGAWQARVLGGDEAGRAGALFNFGIVLFDALLDRGGNAARSRALAFTMPQLEATVGPPEFTFFAAVARRFLDLAGDRVSLNQLEALLAAEVSSVGWSPTLHDLRRKSIGPFMLMASLGHGNASFARIFGRAVWIVDDLWDWDEDYECGVGRPCFRQGTDEEKLAWECRCLAKILIPVRKWPDEARACLGTTLCSWIAMPRPHPLFAVTMAPS